MTQRYVVVDLETDREFPRKKEIQLFNLLAWSSKTTKLWMNTRHSSTLDRKFPCLLKMTGISNETVKNAPDFEDVAENIAQADRRGLFCLPIMFYLIYLFYRKN